MSSAIYQILKRKESLLLLVLLISVSNTFGWLFNIVVLKAFSLQNKAIAPLSVVMFIALTLLFYVKINFKKTRSTNYLVTGSVIIILFICGLILIHFLMNPLWDIENIFIRNPEKLKDIPIGRQSPLTSFLIIILSFSILGIRQAKSAIIKYISGCLSLMTCFISFVLLIGYLYKVPLLYGSSIIPVSLPTSISLFLFGITLLRVSNTQYWTFNLINENPIALKLLKSFLPIIVFIVILEGFLDTIFPFNDANRPLIAAIILLIVIILTVLIVIRISSNLGETLMRAELMLKERNEELTLINTELTKAKEKVEESDHLKSAFLTNMSHEIRTPMNGILGFTELLKEPNLSSDDIQDFVQTIQISGARMLHTINSIVDISRIESGLINVDLKETNINEKIEFTYKFFKPDVENKGLLFSYKNGLASNESIIDTDNEKVYGMLTNLVRNAIKFTFEGSIEFGYVLKSGESPELEFFVKDTGIGIPLNQQEIIFDRFRQGSESHNRGYEGSGLGLSICKSYAEMLGGRIWVESEEAKGSTFYFTVPYIVKSQEKRLIEEVISAEMKEVGLRNLKILIVEDDEISHALLTRTLQEISKEVLHAITGIEAIEICRANPDIDLVLMDIRMPMMDGNEATKRIRKFNRDLIIIAQTAYGFPDDKERAIESGCNDYISKPIDRKHLYSVIKNHLPKIKNLR